MHPIALTLGIVMLTLARLSAADAVAVKDLPPLVVEALRKALPAGKPLSATSEALNDYVHYVVRVSDGEMLRDVRLNENGQIESMREVRE